MTRWTETDLANHQTRRTLAQGPRSAPVKAQLLREHNSVRTNSSPRHDYKADFEQQLSLVGIKFEKEFRFDTERKWRADFHIVGTRILLEYEGGLLRAGAGASHMSIGGVLRDIEKHNAARLQGWTVLRITHKDVASGQALAWVEEALVYC